MPNWCWNYLTIMGESEPISKLKEDISKSVEKKSNTFMEDLTGIEISEDGWYNERIEHFGCKWDIDADELDLALGEDYIEFGVQTAWSPPINFLSHLCKKYGVKGEITYSEPGCDFGGVAKVDESGNVEDECYSYYEHLYQNEGETFWLEVENEMDYSIENEDYTWENIQEKFSFVDMETMNEIKNLYDDMKKEFDERNK